MGEIQLGEGFMADIRGFSDKVLFLRVFLLALFQFYG
jgi:hypothetical protein